MSTGKHTFNLSQYCNRVERTRMRMKEMRIGHTTFINFYHVSWYMRDYRREHNSRERDFTKT